jgi:carbonic anhydrase
VSTASHPEPATPETAYQRIFRRNRAWAREATARDAEFFARRAREQHPQFLFIGCSDSRVPAEMLTGAEPGEMFVHRNVANVVVPTDLNLLSVLHYAVDVLQVRAIVVCGHYGCGGVRAAMGREPHGLVDHWLANVRDVVRLHEDALAAIADEEARYRRLVELSAAEQAYRLRRTPIVQAAWARGQALSVHAMVYDLADGVLRDLAASCDACGDVPDAHVSTWIESLHPDAARGAAERAAGAP